jgi:hypothetical protein
LSQRIPGYDPKWGDYLRTLAGAELLEDERR